MKTFCVVLLLFGLAIGVYSVSKQSDSFRPQKNEQNEKRRINNKFQLFWSDQNVSGYRIATLNEITSETFVSEYNSPGILLGLEMEFGVNCFLSVAEGLLFFPKNDTTGSNFMTIYYSADYGCNLVQKGSSPFVKFETWPYNKGCPDIAFIGIKFKRLTVSYIQENFYAGNEKCGVFANTTSMGIFIKEIDTPTPTPTRHIDHPSPSPITPLSTPSPTPFPPPAPYVCCGYYELSKQFETNFCQFSDELCPKFIGSYVSVGNYTVSDCKDCCSEK